MVKKKLLIVLQCPWKKGKLQKWHPSVWRREFLTSRTGVRLVQEVIPDRGFKIYYANANPSLVDKPSGILPPNLSHVRRRIRQVKPDIILSCGRMAQMAILALGYQEGAIKPGTLFISMPHPASRLLSHKDTQKVRRWLYSELTKE